MTEGFKKANKESRRVMILLVSVFSFYYVVSVFYRVLYVKEGYGKLERVLDFVNIFQYLLYQLVLLTIIGLALNRLRVVIKNTKFTNLNRGHMVLHGSLIIIKLVLILITDFTDVRKV